jgi:hypothetical protein
MSYAPQKSIENKTCLRVSPSLFLPLMNASHTHNTTGAGKAAAQMTKEELFNACIRDLTSSQGKTFSEAYDIMSEGAAGDLFADLFPPKTVYVSEEEFRSIAKTKNAPAVRMLQKAGGTEDSFSVVYRAWGRGPVIDLIHDFVPIF